MRFQREKIQAMLKSLPTDKELATRGYDSRMYDGVEIEMERKRLVSSYLKTKYTSIWDNLKSEADELLTPREEAKKVVEPKMARNSLPPMNVNQEEKDVDVLANKVWNNHRNEAPPLVKKIKQYWEQNLLIPADREEILKLSTRVKNIRNVLGIDIYEAKGLVKKFKIANLKELYERYCFERIKGGVGHMMIDMRKVIFSDKRVSSIENLLLQLDECAFHLTHQVDKRPKLNKSKTLSVLTVITAKKKLLEPIKDHPLHKSNSTSEVQIVPSLTQEEKLVQAEKEAAESVLNIETETRSEYLAACAERFVLPKDKIIDVIAKPQIQLTHFGLGKEGGSALLRALHCNPRVTKLDLTDNWIQRVGGIEVAEWIPHAQHLVTLNLSDNRIGNEATGDILNALISHKVLQSLNLKGNNIDDRIGQRFGALLRSSNLTYLNVSHNRLQSKAIQVISREIESSSTLKELDLTWNSISLPGCRALAKAIGLNHSLQTLRLGWNAIDRYGGYALATSLLPNRTLETIDLSGNRLTTKAAIILADVLKYNRKLSHLDLSQNAIGEQGIQALIFTTQKRSTLLHLTLNMMGYGTDDTDETEDAPFDPFDLVGYHRLNLARPWDYAVAKLLHFRHVRKYGTCINISFHGSPIRFDRNFVMSRDKVLRLEYIVRKQPEKTDKAELIHFRLDLSKPQDRKSLIDLIDRAILEPGENWIGETFNGKEFEFDETRGSIDWLLQAREGILELDYKATNLLCENHYKLHVENPTDRSVARRLLTRLFESIQENGGDEWRNITMDSKPITLKELENPVGDAVPVLTAKQKWRLPLHGVLEFDYYTAHPHQVAAHHYKINLANPQERRVAHDLVVRAQIGGGECWWNEMINGYPFELPEGDLVGYQFPRRGILEFDFVIMRSAKVAAQMEAISYQLDLSQKISFTEAEILRQLSIKFPQEYVWVKTQIDGQYFTALDEPLPPKGVLVFELILCSTLKPTTEINHGLLIEQLETHVNDEATKLAILQLSGNPPKPSKNRVQRNRRRTSLVNDEDRRVYFTAAMVEEYLTHFKEAVSHVQVIQSMYEAIVDKPNILRKAIEMDCQCVAKHVGMLRLQNVQKPFDD